MTKVEDNLDASLTALTTCIIAWFSSYPSKQRMTDVVRQEKMLNAICQPQTQDVSSNADGEADPEILGETDG